MAYPTSNRFRKIDFFTNMYFSENKTPYDDIINDPERFLMNQEDVFAAEGGYFGTMLQVATMGGGIAALLAYKPKIATNFLRGNMSFCQWLMVLGTGLLTYRLGYALGYSIAGEPTRLNNHFTAYHFQKTQNRFEGRINLMKAPMMF